MDSIQALCSTEDETSDIISTGGGPPKDSSWFLLSSHFGALTLNWLNVYWYYACVGQTWPPSQSACRAGAGKFSNMSHMCLQSSHRCNFAFTLSPNPIDIAGVCSSKTPHQSLSVSDKAMEALIPDIPSRRTQIQMSTVFYAPGNVSGTWLPMVSKHLQVWGQRPPNPRSMSRPFAEIPGGPAASALRWCRTTKAHCSSAAWELVEGERATSPAAASRRGKDEYKGKDLVEVAPLGLHFVENLKVESAAFGISLHFSHLQTLPNLVDTLGTSKRGVPGRESQGMQVFKASWHRVQEQWVQT